MKLAVGAEEKLHIAYGIFMVAFYIAGSYKHNNKLMGIQLFLFIAFVICQFFYNQLNELYKIFSINEGKSEFPARRILRINVIMMIVFASFMVIGMLIFYSGKYGNIFQRIFALPVDPGKSYSPQRSDHCRYPATGYSQNQAVFQCLDQISVMKQFLIPFQGKSGKTHRKSCFIKRKYHYHANGQIHKEKQDSQVQS